MSDSTDGLKKALAKAHPNLLDALSRFQEIELHDVELEVDELELVLPQMVTSVTKLVEEAAAEKPSQLLRESFIAPPTKYNTQIIEVKLGATKAEG
ncbi:hypothetical protein MUP59_09545, partial [Candidatus Bathyarchaeota archaeon]|nr:hypothetical protein [Candidatus Bathyarchaeota archaeon]